MNADPRNARTAGSGPVARNVLVRSDVLDRLDGARRQLLTLV